MMVRLDISGRDTMFICQVRVFFPPILSLNRTEGVNGSLNFLSMEQVWREMLLVGKDFFALNI